MSICTNKDGRLQRVGTEKVFQDKLREQFDAVKKEMQNEMLRKFAAIEEGLKHVKDSFFRTEQREKEMIVEMEHVTRLLHDILERGVDDLYINIQEMYRKVDNMKRKLTSSVNQNGKGQGMEESQTSSSSFGQEEEEGGDRATTTTPHSLTRLQVSYLFYNLESHLWKLLLCFSLFPEKAIINKRQIIYRWLGEGLVEANDPSRDREEIAEDLFKELIHKGLIEPVKKRGATYDNPVVKRCRMHPMIYQHVNAHAKQQGYFDFHSCLTKNDDEGRPFHPSELKTLFNLDARYLKLNKGWFSGKEKVTVLQLGRWKSCPKQHIEITDNTGLLEDLKQKLKNLRYLSLRGVSDVIELPAGVGDLVNLIILDLRACHNLESLTTRIALLRKLTHLDVSECYLLDNIPEELAQLSELQNLGKLDLRCLPTENPPKWLTPNTLVGLKKLYIRGGQLKRLPFEPGTLWEKVEVLRLKCLKKVEDMDLSKPRKLFPELIYLEVFQCDKIQIPSSSKDGVWVWEG
ncbi:hypothetical protein QJS10_CPB15g01330 [Acorus calamus]|uniref:Disease resistance RPP13-like protein 4 n=1 Tax=Acorus calamus TaxID=4465 RepID=A0AAV9D4L5_ACOCL|nr:hypothetical protein QJS10_CPB15g01330 [Acorus calamus]